MQNRATTVVLSIIAFAATAGLVIAAGGSGADSSSSIQRTTATTVAASPAARTEKPRWLGVDNAVAKPAMRLKPRVIKAKPDFIERPGLASGSRLVVKFTDELRLRVLPDGTLLSLNGFDTTDLNNLFDENGVILEPVANVPEERIQAIINRAELHSGKAQPDLAGMYHVTGFRRDVDAISKALLRHDQVEWAEFQGMDDYTSNMVSLAEAPVAAPSPPIEPRQPAPILSAPLVKQGKGTPQDLPLGPLGSCCIYSPDNSVPDDSVYTYTCDDDGGAGITLTDCNAIANPVAGIFTVWGTQSNCALVDCTNNLIGACCLQTGVCADLFFNDCNILGGTYNGGAWTGGFGVETTNACGNTGLPACNSATGACCFPGLTPNCTDGFNNAADCGNAGGLWNGLGTTCASGLCDPPAAEQGACCFAEDEPLVPLSNTVVNAAGTLGCFTDDTSDCQGDGSTDYPFGSTNPAMVKYCEIVFSSGTPGTPDFVTAEEACSDAGGEFVGTDSTCIDCPVFGACCDDGECENTFLIDCADAESVEDGRFFVQLEVATNPRYWPTGGQSVLGGAYDLQTGRTIDTHFVSSIDISVGNIPWAGDGTCPIPPFSSFMTNLADNVSQVEALWTGFEGFTSADPGFTAVVTPRPIAVQQGGPGAPVITAAYAIACNGSQYCQYSYCTPYCYGEFVSQGQEFDGCNIFEDPGKPISCFGPIFDSSLNPLFNIGQGIPITRCGSQLPWFCGNGTLDAFGQPVPITTDRGCTDFYNPALFDPSEALGLTCQISVDEPLQPAGCGSADTLIENQLRGSCYWNRKIFPSYLESYEPALGGATPWGAIPLCYDGPYCDNYLCCDDVCAIAPQCCTDIDWPGVGGWNGDCAAVALGIALGQYQNVANCPGPTWFPTIPGLTVPYPAACGLSLAANNQCMSPSDVLGIEGFGDGAFRTGVTGGCSDLECCAKVCQIEPACGIAWTQDCVDIAKQLCYYTVPVNTDSPDFTPLQFHLLGRSVGSGTAQDGVPGFMRPLIPSPYYVFDENQQVPSYQSLQGVDAFDFSPFFGSQAPPRAANSRFQGPGLELQQQVDFTPSSGLYSWGEFMADISRGLHPAGPNVNGTKGLGVKVAVLDLAAWVQTYVDFEGNIQGAVHEDLLNVKLEGRDTPHPPVRMIFEPVATRPQRGTAVLGIIAAEENGFGVTGVAPQCQPYFFPMVDADLGFREVTAWINAIDSLGYGDIILATYRPNYYNPACDSSCLLNNASARALMEVATNAGIIVVTPAGDLACDIDASLAGQDNIDVIAVGGAMTNPFAQRYWTSNYGVTTVESAPTGISCSSWGQVVTTGGNMNLTEVAIATQSDNPGGDPDGYISRDKKTKSYTNDFGNNTIDGGSVAASALVAGSIACVQGFSLQRYGQGQSPAVMQQFPWDFGQPQQTPTGNNFNSESEDARPHYWHFDMEKTDAGYWSVQRMIKPDRMGVALVTDSDYALDNSGWITQAKLIRGTSYAGNLSSLRELDENYLAAYSELTGTGFYNPPFYVPGSPYYSSVGQYVDLMIEFTIPAATPIGNQIDTTVTLVNPDFPSTIEMYCWNWSLGKWQFMGIYALGDEPIDELTFTNFAGTANEIRNSEGKIYQRAVVISAGNSGGNDGPSFGFLTQFDSIVLEFIPGFGGGGPPG